ncbi:MAG: hypothetical protein WAK29_11410 [Terriglobales bacterium]
MGRRLDEATKACRARRTRGETGLCLFRELVVEAVFFVFAGTFLVAPLFAAEDFAGARLAGAAFFFGGVLSEVAED